MAKTNTGLVAYANAKVGHPYWYGCYGQVSTQALYNSKKKQYPSYYQWSCINNQPGVSPKTQLGVQVFDCIGLIKGYLWSDSTNATPKYNAAQDVSANGMRGKCTKSGSISTLPEVPGILLFSQGHVGVYIGGGYAIEARGHKYGVVKTKVKDRGWTSWGYCPWITYENKTSWKKENNKWYYYVNNKKVTNKWIKYNNNWYWLDSNGVMAADKWVKYKNKWYYLTSTGAMKTGWLKYKNNWYYLDSDGSMRTKDLVCKFTSDGKLIS